MGKYALALDNLLAVELVLADGRSSRPARTRIRTCSGRCAAAAAISAWRRRWNTVCIRSDPSSPAASSPIRSRGLGVLRFFRDITASLPDELMVFGGLHPCAGRIGQSWRRWWCAIAGRRARREGGAPIKAFGAPAMDASARCRTPDEHNAGRGLSARRAQLLEVGLPRWPERRCDPHDDRLLRAMPDADGSIAVRALPRRGHPYRRHGHRIPAPAPGYNLLVLSQWADPKDNTACTAWAGIPTPRCSLSWVAAGTSIISETMNRATWSPRPMGRTTAGLQQVKANTIPKLLPHEPEHSPMRPSWAAAQSAVRSKENPRPGC